MINQHSPDTGTDDVSMYVYRVGRLDCVQRIATDVNTPFDSASR